MQGVVVFVNSKTRHVVGYDTEEILNQPFLKVCLCPKRDPAFWNVFRKRVVGEANSLQI